MSQAHKILTCLGYITESHRRVVGIFPISQCIYNKSIGLIVNGMDHS